MLTCSSDSARHTPPSAPGLFCKRRLSSVRIAMMVGAYRTLGEHANDDATVLRTTFLRLVVRRRLGHPVTDHIDLVQRHLMLLVQVALHSLRALEPEFLVVFSGP